MAGLDPAIHAPAVPQRTSVLKPIHAVFATSSIQNKNHHPFRPPIVTMINAMLSNRAHAKATAQA
jgi:hypothetical protein